MRQLIFSMFLLFMATSPSLLAQKTFQYAVDYNDFIIQEQNKIGMAIQDFMQACGKGKKKSMTEKHALVLQQVDLSTQELKSLPPYKGNTQFKEAALRLFAMYKSVAQNEYMDIIAIVDEGMDISNNAQRFQNVLMRIEERSKQVNDDFLAAQAVFATQFKVNLGENNLEKDLKDKP